MLVSIHSFFSSLGECIEKVARLQRILLLLSLYFQNKMQRVR